MLSLSDIISSVALYTPLVYMRLACVCVGLQQFVESTSVDVCLAELQSLEYGEVRAQCRLRVAQSLVVAVDNASDAIEITDENHHTQVLSKFTVSRTFPAHSQHAHLDYRRSWKFEL